MRCFYQRDETRYSLDEERKRAARFFEAHHCAAIADPQKPTILIVGDSHAAHLFAGLQEIYGAKANLLTLSSVFCVPLVENVAMDQGVAGTPRCRAINDYVFDAIRRIKPDVLIVGGYFAQYDHEANWRYPGYLDALVAGARRLHARRRALDHRRRPGSDLGARSAHPRRPRRPRARRGGGILADRRQARLARN